MVVFRITLVVILIFYAIESFYESFCRRAKTGRKTSRREHKRNQPSSAALNIENSSYISHACNVENTRKQLCNRAKNRFLGFSQNSFMQIKRNLREMKKQTLEFVKKIKDGNMINSRRFIIEKFFDLDLVVDLAHYGIEIDNEKLKCPMRENRDKAFYR